MFEISHRGGVDSVAAGFFSSPRLLWADFAPTRAVEQCNGAHACNTCTSRGKLLHAVHLRFSGMVRFSENTRVANSSDGLSSNVKRT
jgi:hypothetical protein